MNNESERSAMEAALERIREEPLLGTFAVPLPSLRSDGSDDVGPTFVRLGELIGSSEKASLSFRIADDVNTQTWALEIGPDGCAVTPQPTMRPDVEVLLEPETWRRIADGSVSPLEAFGIGKMRVRGDIQIALRVFRQLQTPRQ
jgi:SCP-2 sterol transfer family